MLKGQHSRYISALKEVVVVVVLRELPGSWDVPGSQGSLFLFIKSFTKTNKYTLISMPPASASSTSAGLSCIFVPP